jgi:hypothetical protein
MVRFDRGRRPFDRNRFNDIRVNGALPEPFYVFNEMSFLIKNINERFTDGLAFGFRVGQSF